MSSDGSASGSNVHSAMAVKRWLHEQGLQSTSIDVVTVGPRTHAGPASSMARLGRLIVRRRSGPAV